jgi:oxalate decarboxylase/phosphoglucose isomerase-like protein (cupin superfamily)
MNQQKHNETRVRYTNAVNDEAASHFDWGSIQWLCSNEFHADGNLTFGYVQIEPGQKNPRHYHPNSSEVLFLIEGELEHSLGDQLIHLTAGMSIFIPQGAGHDAFNRGSVTARMVVCYPTGDRQIVMLEAGNDR